MECSNGTAKDENIEMMKSLSTLHFCNLSYSVPEGKKKKLIIDDVSGRLEAGRLGAILGPSGAGKTTLMNILSGFKIKNVSGSILVDGSLRNVNVFRKMSTYISQTFPMFDNLTVYETLKVSADLKLGTNVSPEAKSDNVSYSNYMFCDKVNYYEKINWLYLCDYFVLLRNSFISSLTKIKSSIPFTYLLKFW